MLTEKTDFEQSVPSIVKAVCYTGFMKKKSSCRMKAGWITILSWFGGRNTQAAELCKVPAAAVHGTILIKYQEASMNQILPLVCFCCKWWEFWLQSNRLLKNMYNFEVVSNPLISMTF